MTVKAETGPKLQPLVIDGKVVPGLFTFDRLLRNTDLERKKIFLDLEQAAKRARKIASPKNSPNPNCTP